MVVLFSGTAVQDASSVLSWLTASVSARHIDAAEGSLAADGSAMEVGMRFACHRKKGHIFPSVDTVGSTVDIDLRCQVPGVAVQSPPHSYSRPWNRRGGAGTAVWCYRPAHLDIHQFFLERGLQSYDGTWRRSRATPEWCYGTRRQYGLHQRTPARCGGRTRRHVMRHRSNKYWHDAWVAIVGLVVRSDTSLGSAWCLKLEIL
jgi:hypothetical protein